MRRSLLAALLAAGLLAAGCGGGGDEPQTKDGFIDDGDTVCDSLAIRFEAAGATDPQTAEEIKQSNDVLADLYGELSNGLQKVELPPGAARAGASAFIDSVKSTDPLLAQLKSASQAFVDATGADDRRALAKAGNDVRSALDAFRAQTAASDRLAIEYGFRSCGNLG